MQENKVNISDIMGERLDSYFHSPIFYHEINLLHKSPYKLYKLNELCHQITDGTHYTPEYVNKGIKFISVKDIKENLIDFQNTKFISKEEHEILTQRCRPEPGDVLLTKIGTIGNVCVVPDDAPEFSIFVSVALLKVKKEVITPLYLQVALSMLFAKNQIKRELKGIGVPDLHLENICNIQIPVPDNINKQIEIAKILKDAYLQKNKKENEAQELINSIKDLLLNELNIKIPNIEDKKELKTNFSNMFNCRFSPKMHQETPMGIIKSIKNTKYNKIKLKDLITETFSGEWGKDIENISLDNHVIMNVLRNKNFNNIFNIDYSDIAQRYIPLFKQNGITLQQNDILIEKSGGSPQQPVGRVAIIDKNLENYTFSNFLQMIRINSKICSSFYLYIYLKTLYKLNYTKYIQSQTTGIINLIMDDFFNIPIIIPEKAIQDKIVKEYNDRITEAKKLIDDANKEFEKAKERVEKIILGEENL